MTERSNYTVLDIDQWSRKNQFRFFKDYSDPCFNVTADIDVTDILNYCKQHNYSFFLTSLYITLQAINQVEELRLRYIDDEVRLYDQIDGGCTILKDDHTFGFAYFNFTNDLQAFMAQGRDAIQQVKLGHGLIARDDDMDLVHCSSLPWVSFTSFKHARDRSKNQSIPKLVFGKYRNIGDRIVMPLSIEIMHALVDGYHIGRFYNLLDDIIKTY